jgi:sugar O-acyltransferase (sialic acid O-acetyltransferase NeuD family)
VRHLPDPGPLVIVGAGGFGRECLDIVEALNEDGAGISFLGFVDDGGGDPDLLARRHVACLGPVHDAADHAARYVIAIGDGSVRTTIAARLTAAGMAAPVLVHPQATLGSACTVGAGMILNAGARATTNVTFGDHVQLHANAAVGHDAVLEDAVSVFPGATVSGAVVLEREVTIGTGANVLPGVRVGARSFVGAGAVVVADVPADTVVAGVPARVIRRRD